ncbi:repetin [Mus pahari]|uniref:repetin n=1 Tax=Mus pahari TaxID=10093 RepID=UPI000A30C858|nr:repetin [Mus pahari]
MSQTHSQRYQDRREQQIQQQAWKPKEDSQHKLLAQVQQEPYSHEEYDWQSQSSEQDLWGEEEHQDWDRHSVENLYEMQNWQTHEEEQSHQTSDRQTHVDEQNQQRQHRQTHEENHDHQHGRHREDEQNHRRQDHHQQRERQTHEENEKYQGGQDQSRSFPNREKFHLSEDDQCEGPQGRHFHSTHGGEKSQREKSGNHPTKPANYSSPLYDYVQEQAAYQY